MTIIITAYLILLDPAYAGFHQIKDETQLPIDLITIGRRKFFREGDSIGQQLLEAYIREVQSFYNTKSENRQTLQRGFVFFIVTCLLDWYVCVM
jgi:hypothetical protein